MLEAKHYTLVTKNSAMKEKFLNRNKSKEVEMMPQSAKQDTLRQQLKAKRDPSITKWQTKSVINPCTIILSNLLLHIYITTLSRYPHSYLSKV